jgi:hypothetical protein
VEKTKRKGKKCLFCHPQGNYIGRIFSSLTLFRNYKIVQITTNKKDIWSIYALYGNAVPFGDVRQPKLAETIANANGYSSSAAAAISVKRDASLCDKALGSQNL